MPNPGSLFDLPEEVTSLETEPLEEAEEVAAEEEYTEPQEQAVLKRHLSDNAIKDMLQEEAEELEAEVQEQAVLTDTEAEAEVVENHAEKLAEVEAAFDEVVPLDENVTEKPEAVTNRNEVLEGGNYPPAVVVSAGIEPSETEAADRWDTVLGSLSAKTRELVFEQNVLNEVMLQNQTQDRMLKPFGVFTQPTLNEFFNVLTDNGIALPPERAAHYAPLVGVAYPEGDKDPGSNASRNARVARMAKLRPGAR